MEASQLRSWLALLHLPNVGPVTFSKLIEAFGSVDNLFQASKQELIAKGCKEALAQLLLNPPWDKADKELELAQKHGITIITKLDPEYPESLKNISLAPVVLYAQGQLSALTANPNAIAVVGSRQTSPYGIQNCKNFVTQLIQNQITIVSGFARGIDINAHMTALEAGGTTIAVLGSGLGAVYPVENNKYIHRILEKGLMLSEFPYNTEARPEYFPRRNRVVSGLSRGVLVVECAERSGALITANYAADQGRDVFAIPGAINSNLSKGPHKLISQGARLVQSASDILQEWNLMTSQDVERKSSLPLGRETERGGDQLGPTPLPNPPPTGGGDILAKFQHADQLSRETERGGAKNLKEEWKAVYALCQNEAQIPGALCLQTGLPSSDLLTILTQMEMAGHLKRLPGNRYLTA